MRVLYYDCFAGISGDMNLGALLDLGVEEAYLRDELAKLGLSGYQIRVRREARRGISGTRVEVVLEPQAQPLRTLSSVREVISASDLSAGVKDLSHRVFTRLAQAEATVHGLELDEVHFHEVGAVDALIDVVGAALALERLGVERIMSSSVELGGGLVKCAHGTLPVPAPATQELVRDLPTRRGAVPFEATTPTGAAILASVVDQFTDTPSLTVEGVGYGVGRREAALPNLLRVLLADQRGGFEDGLSLLECNIDDMNPELYEYVLERLLEQGAKDVWLTPVTMKKGRPGILLSALASSALAEPLTALLFTETTTLGVRRHGVGRSALYRETRQVNTRYGTIPVKAAYREGRRLKSKAEYEVCKRVARERGVSLREVYEAVDRCLDDETER